MIERLWSPWRSRYVGDATADDADCVFCAALATGDDRKLGVLHRGEQAFVLLNAFPYNSGHLMVAPNRHVGKLGDLEPSERHELIDLASTSVDVLGRTFSPQGFNLGANLGRVAGAGVPGHVHLHVVPRWGGDTNFMAVVGETKVLPEDLETTYDKLKGRF